MKLKHLTFADYRELPWKNGRGKTTEIFIWPEGASFRTDPFLWRVSSAPITESGPFSSFPGYDRMLLLLEGGSLRLSHRGIDSPRTVGLNSPDQFKGEWETRCEIGTEAVRDLNLMVRRDAAEASFEVRELGRGTDRVVAHGQQVLIFCVQGSLEALVGDEKQRLLKRETLLIEIDHEKSLDLQFKSAASGTRIVVIQVRPRHDQPLG